MRWRWSKGLILPLTFRLAVPTGQEVIQNKIIFITPLPSEWKLCGRGSEKLCFYLEWNIQMLSPACVCQFCGFYMNLNSVSIKTSYSSLFHAIPVFKVPSASNVLKLQLLLCLPLYSLAAAPSYTTVFPWTGFHPCGSPVSEVLFLSCAIAVIS